MKNILIAALLAVSATCQQRASVEAELHTQEIKLPIQEISAVVVGSQLPVDGFDAHLWLDFNNGYSSDFWSYMRIPTPATQSLMDNIIKAEVAKQPAGTLWMGSKGVTICYQETGQTSTLLCGWNKKQAVKTIELLEIRGR